MFNPVDPKKSIPDLELEQIKYWNVNKIFEKSVINRENNQKFVFFDGPPFANGLPHYGHILAQSLKDAVTRYWAMKGYYVPRTNGWDCHGLPVEYEIEKELGLSGHRDILELGVENFNAKCKESVFKYTNEWDGLFERLGRWYDADETYATLENRYMESIWWVFKQIWDKQLVYKGYRVMHICPRCETSLSNFEVNQGYKDVTDLSAIAKFELTDEPGTYILAWTTTPWTLPGNQGLAMGKEIMYSKVEFEGQKYIVASDRLEYTFKDPESYTVIAEFPSTELKGKKYNPVFDYYKSLSDKNFTVMLADFVTTEDGTGIVHIAGGYGEDDYNLCKEHGLEIIQHVKINGHFSPEVTDFADKFVKGQDQNICDNLKARNLLFRSENYRHSYPHCWRDDTPLINYCMDAWFINVTEIKDRLIENNQKINWQPNHIKDGRFGRWLENVKDWNISRNRFWGCPIPIWECENCEHSECLSSIHELRNKAKASNNITFVRHGFAEHNEKGVLNSNLNDTSNLTPKGEAEVAELAAKLKASKSKFDVIITSPFPRTIQTAEILNQKFKAEIIVSDRIRERDSGSLDGRPVEEQFSEIHASKDPYSHNPGETGESLKDLEERMVKFLDEVAAKYEGKNILVVSHAGPISAIKRYLDGLGTDAETIRTLPKVAQDEFYEYTIGNIPINKEGELDLHKPYIDFVKLNCSNCASQGKKGTMNRVTEVFDCWFESGAMPYAQMHYPFENKEDFETNFPANFIAEGLDQTRGWFYTLHVLATILFDKPAFNNVIVNGILLAKNGEKLSKRKKNYPDPTILFGTKGVDATRLFMYQSTAPLAEDVRFSEDHVDEILKKFILTLYNTYSFFVTYSNIDNFDPEIDGNLEGKELHELDQWLLSEFNQLIIEVTQNMDEYNLPKATRPLIDFVDNLSNWYIRRSRRRFWKSENDNDKKQAYATLHFVLTELCKLIAPFTPFISDEIYRNLTGHESVHLQDWPRPNHDKIDLTLNKKMSLARTIVSLGHAIRSQENLKVRQPLAKIKVAVPDDTLIKYVSELKDVITEELNVKELEILENPDKEVTKNLKANAKELGPILGEKMKEVLEAARNNQFEIIENTVHICGEKLGIDKFEVVYQAKPGFSAQSENGVVAVLDTNITKALKQEGLVRDVVRIVQEFRKEMDYNVSDRIYLYVNSEDAELTEAIQNFADYLKRETLAIELQNSDDFEWDSEKLTDIEEVPVTIALKKAEI